MAAGQGFKTFATGDVLTAADTNGYLMQGVLVFASAAARDLAITSPQEGQFAYLKDTNVTMYYTGSAWANLDTTGMTNPMTNTGDTIYSSSGSTPARLGIGTTGQVLTVAGGVPSWATASSGSLTLLSTTAITAVATISITGISQSYKNLFIYMDNFRPNAIDILRMTPYNTSSVLPTATVETRWFSSTGTVSHFGSSNGNIVQDMATIVFGRNALGLTISQYTTSTNHPISGSYAVTATVSGSTNTSAGMIGGGTFNTTGALPINRLDFSFQGGTTFTAQGNIYIYGVN
jgi:hypothetical protein